MRDVRGMAPSACRCQDENPCNPLQMRVVFRDGELSAGLTRPAVQLAGTCGNLRL
jgi:hypothetical protein